MTPSLEVSASTITKNDANGGRGGKGGGSDGQGIGGGVYNLGMFSDLATVIARNHASTSNNDIFT